MAASHVISVPPGQIAAEKNVAFFSATESSQIERKDRFPRFKMKKRPEREQDALRCRVLVFLVDVVMAVLGLVAAYFIRFEVGAAILPEDFFLSPSRGVTFPLYLPRIFAGSALAIGILLFCGAYESYAVLRFRRAVPVVAKALVIWLVAVPGLSLILELDERLSRFYIFVSFFCLAITLLSGRRLMQYLFAMTGATASFRQRILFVDWTANSALLARATIRDRWHPYELVGCAPSPLNRFTIQPPPEIQTVGSHAEVQQLCENGLVDIVILSDGANRTEQQILDMARTCEKSMVDFMVMPTGFQVLLSGLHLTTVSSVPLLGITKLPLDHPLNALVKRLIDIAGSIIGLIFSAPLIAIFCLLVYRESPGPVIYRQRRVGRKGKQFDILKIRSMKLDAEALSGPRWAGKNDDRRLRIGAFMRRTNIDELPQFWNVLWGDLSLVGPRPERPELIREFRENIAFYNARHNIIPGMTGWAQINGLRGECDLAERIRFDLYYIENWSVILDLQIMVMTFFRWKNAQ
jgi:exopolysaccharide biosynthesis polyprenyl glycosylphosphotransferase